MNASADRARIVIKSVTEILLDPRDNFFHLSDAIKDFRTLVYAAAGMEIESQQNRQALFFNNGKAIGAFWAAKCLDEVLRTKRFVSGLYKAVRDARQMNTKRPIRVLYAGTGPFATLMIPLTAMFSADEVQFTLMEINPKTFELLKETITALGLTDYVASFELCDATTFRIPEDQKPDIIVSETMQHALTREMQVPVIFNLATQAGEKTVIIPERINLELVWMDAGVAVENIIEGTSDRTTYRSLGDFFTLDRSLVKEFGAQFSHEHLAFSFPGKTFVLEPESEREELAILTTIKVYEDDCLGMNECSLTIPYKMSRLTRGDLRSGTIRMGYKISDRPAPEIKVLQPA